MNCSQMTMAVTAGERQQGAALEAAAREASVEVHAIANMQERLRAALGGDTGAISATRILHLYLERLGVDFKVWHHPAYFPYSNVYALH